MRRNLELPAGSSLRRSACFSWLAFLQCRQVTEQSEDCLFLSILVPQGGSQLPVIVFIHGGGYISGSNNETIYYGEHGASTGRSIYAILNYRLNILGFPSTHPVDGIDQNVGLAPEWLVENIAKFGDDPSRMIITGESASGHMTHLLLLHTKRSQSSSEKLLLLVCLEQCSEDFRMQQHHRCIAGGSNREYMLIPNSFTSRYRECVMFPSTASYTLLLNCPSRSCPVQMGRLYSETRRILSVGRTGRSLAFQHCLRM
jgi:hypothetical protein